MKSTGAETKGEGEKGGGVNPDDSQRWVRIERGTEEHCHCQSIKAKKMEKEVTSSVSPQRGLGRPGLCVLMPDGHPDHLDTQVPMLASRGVSASASK